MNNDQTQKIKSNTKKWLILIGATLAILVCGMVLYKITIGASRKAENCVKIGGHFDAEFRECTWITEDDCNSIGGKFVECASICRHMQTEVCPTVCAQYCQL